MQYDVEQLLEAIRFNTQEVLPTKDEQLESEVKKLVELANKSGEPIKHYIGFEISGLLHFAGCYYQMMNVAKLQKAGVKCMLWMADYHTKINSKFGGDMKVIRKIAHEYFEPNFRTALDAVGGNGDEVEILYAESEYFRPDKNGEYFWDYEFEAEKNFTVSRALRSLGAAGKEAGMDSQFMVTRYPGMQSADVFWHQTHIVQGGLDQRKLYVLSRDMATKLNDKYLLKLGGEPVQPVIIFNQLLLGLEGPAKSVEGGNMDKVEVNKMSKSKPDSAIWIHDDYDEIFRKLKKAYCPMPQKDQSQEEIIAEQEWNPMLDWSKKFIFPGGKIIKIERDEKWGGNISFETYQELEDAYFKGDVHPLDLKTSVARVLADWMKPNQDWASANPEIIKFINQQKR